jgi:hypothetical protein
MAWAFILARPTYKILSERDNILFYFKIVIKSSKQVYTSSYFIYYYFLKENKPNFSPK